MQHLWVRNLYAVLMVGRNGSRPAARCMRRLGDNIKMCLKWDGGSWTWINVAQDGDKWPAGVITVLHLRAPYSATKLLTS